MQAGFDAAIIEGLLEKEPWDRWLLQRVHHLLRLHAQIVVVVPPLTPMLAATDLGFLAYASRKILVRFVQLWRPGFELQGRVRRRYDMPWLVRKMESLGYEAVEPSPAWLARRSALTARKGSSLSGLHGRGWPDAQAHRARHARNYAAVSAAREAWLSKFPEYRGLSARALEPSEWRDARVLALSPHPDDELIGCGGTLCGLVSAGAKVTILQATDGSGLHSLRDLPPERRKTVRLDEASNVAAALGADLVLWRQEDGRLRCSGEAAAGLARVLGELRPTHVFTPFVGDPHDDHRTLSRILGDALGPARLQPQVLQYEVWSRVPANLYCDITDHVEALEALLLLYDRAMRADDFVHFCESRNLARSLELTARPGYVEAFLSTTGTEYRRLVERTAQG
jgi:LmbE family N-acetylglucosaminyl deacetylase